MMRWLCLLGWHRWYVFPQATPVEVLEAGGVEAFCARCCRAEVIWP